MTQQEENRVFFDSLDEDLAEWVLSKVEGSNKFIEMVSIALQMQTIRQINRLILQVERVDDTLSGGIATYKAVEF